MLVSASCIPEPGFSHPLESWADSGSYGGGPQWRFLPFAEEAAGGFSAVVMSRKRMEPRYRTGALGALGRGREMSFLSIFGQHETVVGAVETLHNPVAI